MNFILLSTLQNYNKQVLRFIMLVIYVFYSRSFQRRIVDYLLLITEVKKQYD